MKTRTCGIERRRIALENILYCFTGTGNSLAVANEIARHMGDTVVVSMSGQTAQEQASRYTRVGFVFPVYYGCLPPIVAQSIRALDFQKGQYIWGVACCAAQAGNAFTQLQDLIDARGGLLHAAFKVLMPGNHIVEYPAFPLWMQKRRILNASKAAERIAEAALKKQRTRIPKGNFYARATRKACQRIVEGFGESAKNFTADARCAKCALCSRICPAQNIRLIEGVPTWGNGCHRCMACIQWCPQRAINFGAKTVNRMRYHHPGINASNLTLPRPAQAYADHFVPQRERDGARHVARD